MPEQNDILEMTDILDHLQDDILNDPIQDLDDASDLNAADYAAAAAALEDDMSAPVDTEPEKEDLEAGSMEDIPETAAALDPVTGTDSQDLMDELITQPEVTEMSADVTEGFQTELNSDLSDTVEGQMESPEEIADGLEDIQQDFGVGNNESHITTELDGLTDRDPADTADIQTQDMDVSPFHDFDQQDSLAIRVVDANEFAAIEIMEPGTAYVVTGDNLESPVLVYPDENGNMHAADTFYAVDGGFLVSGPDAEPSIIDPVTGDTVQSIEAVADYIDSRVMDMTGDLYESVQQDLEMTDFEASAQDLEAGNFEATMDTGIDTDSFLPDSVDAFPRSDTPEYDPVDTGFQDAPETDRYQDFLPDNDLMSSELDLRGQDTVTAENMQQETEADVGMDMFSYDNSNDFENGMDQSESDYADDAGYDEPLSDWSSDFEEYDWEQREED